MLNVRPLWCCHKRKWPGWSIYQKCSPFWPSGSAFCSYLSLSIWYTILIAAEQYTCNWEGLLALQLLPITPRLFVALSGCLSGSISLFYSTLCVISHTLVQTTKRVKIAAIQWDWFTSNFSGKASSFAVPLPSAWPIVLASIKNNPHSTSQILEIFVNLQEKNNPNA